MSRSSRTTAKALPPPTASEAKFERVLAQFRRDGRQVEPRDGAQSKPKPPDHAATLDRLFAASKSFLKRDDFAGIGQRDSFPTKIMGVSFEGRQDVVAGLVPGLDLELRRQPDNPHDANAIAVHYGTLHLGFLRKQIARHLAPLIDGGARYRARIEHVTGGSAASSGRAKNFGVNIRVERETHGHVDAFDVQPRAQSDREQIRAALLGDYRPHDAQHQLLARIDAGKNALAVLGTGRGKSFCFQYPAACRALESGQKTLVIYPLRALANDQFEALQRRLDGFGLRIFRANGAISPLERSALMQALSDGNWDIVLATPEFLQFHREAFSGPSSPAFVVVDEAHHMYESKHRAAYGRLGETVASLGKPQVLALTATAGDDAFEQIVADLRIDSWVVDPTVRENLHVVDARGTRQKPAYLAELFEREDGKGIIYCNSRSEAAKIAERLRFPFRNEVMFYHAGMPSSERAEVESLFRGGQLRLIVATSAFGEGIDLPDVRNVVLYHLNFDFTEFNQQAGRAGRDGVPAQIHLLFGEADRRINEFIIDQESPTISVLRLLYKGMRELAPDGTLHMTFVDIARTLDLDKADERTVGVAVRIFEDEGLLESGVDDDGRYIRFKRVNGKVDLTKNERFAEGEAAREDFARFCDLILTSNAQSLERIINRPIYPERVELLR